MPNGFLWGPKYKQFQNKSDSEGTINICTNLNFLVFLFIYLANTWGFNY